MTSTQRWECPRCGRGFGRVGQGHTCAPGMTLEQYYAARPLYEREIFDAVLAALEPVGPVHVEAVNVGIFLKRGRTFASLRHKTRWVRLGMLLPRRVDDLRLHSGRERLGTRNFHWMNLRSAEEVDEEVAGWLAESCLSSDG